MNEVILVLFLCFFDLMFPQVYRLFRLDIKNAPKDVWKLYKYYRILSIPRTPLLLVVLCMIVFAPKGIENNVVLLSSLIASIILYVIFALIDSNKAITRD